VDAFVKAIEARAAPTIVFDDGRRGLLIAEAGVRSAKSGLPGAQQV
jgi:predicted dehydrogenase